MGSCAQTTKKGNWNKMVFSKKNLNEKGEMVLNKAYTEIFVPVIRLEAIIIALSFVAFNKNISTNGCEKYISNLLYK